MIRGEGRVFAIPTTFGPNVAFPWTAKDGKVGMEKLVLCVGPSIMEITKIIATTLSDTGYDWATNLVVQFLNRLGFLDLVKILVDWM